MHNWISATGVGIALGLFFYLCVRLRMHYAPILKNRYGSKARLACWLLTILVMVVAANAALIGLRTYLGDEFAAVEMLRLEIWFASLAVLVAMVLILRRLKRNSSMESCAK